MAYTVIHLTSTANGLLTWIDSDGNINTVATVTADAFVGDGSGLDGVQPASTNLTSIAGLSLSGNALKVLRVNSGATAFELGDAVAGADDVVYDFSTLTALSALAAGDVVGVLDVSDTTQGASGTAKKTTLDDIKTFIAAGSGTVTSVDVSGGTTGLTFSGGPITSSGSLTLGGTLAVANGGTGSTTASDARTALGLAIGTDVQAADATLTALAGVSTSADQLIYATEADTFSTTTISSYGRSLIDDADASTARTTLGLGTIATQDANAVAITGGSVAGITDLAIADGGTGASDASGARTNLGLGDSATLDVGTTAGTVAAGDHTHSGVYQPLDATLTALAGLATGPNFLIYSTGTDAFAVSTITSLGRTLVGQANASSMRVVLELGDSATKNVGTAAGTVAAGDHTHTGVYQPLDATLTALAGVSTSANKLIYATGTDVFTTTDLTAVGRSVCGAANQAELINLIRQAGEIQAFAHGSAPAGNWLACDGSAYLKTDYPALYAAIGTAWGSPSSLFFCVPDLRRRTLVGSGGTGTGTLGNSVGSTGGAETHTLSTSEMPSHSHGSDQYVMGGVGTTANVSTGGGGYQLVYPISAGGGGSHNNLQPSAVVAYWIKY